MVSYLLPCLAAKRYPNEFGLFERYIFIKLVKTKSDLIVQKQDVLVFEPIADVFFTLTVVMTLAHLELN